MTPEQRRERGRLAAMSRWRGSDDPEVTDARRAAAAGRIAGDVEEWLKHWAPTPEQVSAITAILNPDGDR
jgi:hypothetical protein